MWEFFSVVGKCWMNPCSSLKKKLSAENSPNSSSEFSKKSLVTSWISKINTNHWNPPRVSHQNQTPPRFWHKHRMLIFRMNFRHLKRSNLYIKNSHCNHIREIQIALGKSCNVWQVWHFMKSTTRSAKLVFQFSRTNSKHPCQEWKSHYQVIADSSKSDLANCERKKKVGKEGPR